MGKKTSSGDPDQIVMQLEIEKKRSAEYVKEVASLKEKIGLRDSELKKKEQDLSSLKEECEKLGETKAKLDEAVEGLKKENEKLLQQNENLVQYERNAANLKAQCSTYEQKLGELRLLHVNLKEEVEAPRRLLDEQKQALADAFKRLEKDQQAMADEKKKLSEQGQKLSVAQQDLAQAQKLFALRSEQSQVTERNANEAMAKAKEELLRAEKARLEREARHAELRASEQVAALQDEELKRRKKGVADEEAKLNDTRQTQVRERGEIDAFRATLKAERAAFELERTQWQTSHAARLQQAEAEERNARAGAIAESQRRCEDLEARAKEQYEAHIKTAQDRARDLEAAAKAKHDELIETALSDDENRRKAFAEERQEKEKSHQEEVARRLTRANQQAQRIEDEAVAKRSAVETRAAELEKLMEAAHAKQRSYEQAQQDVEELKSTLERRKQRLDEHIAAAASARLQPLQAELLAREARIEKLQQMLNSETHRRTELDALITGSGGDTVPGLKKSLDAARERVTELEQRLCEVPRQEDVDRLRERADLAQVHEQAAHQLRMRIAQLENLRALSESERIQHTGERAVAETLRATNQALRQELDHLKALVDQQVTNPLRAFQEVYEKVERPTGQMVPPKSLDALARHLRHRMAALPNGRARYYSSNVVATFLGALASTRMLLLEGLSGTGKTSLPVAAAEALGAGCEVIEVQSQWRDRGDLVGTYNPFHKRFYAQPFALALYRAGLPGFRERPFFIILDELNLSHVEHYFADLLSLLERDACEHRLRLIDDPEALASAPFTKGLVNDSRYGWSVEIPPNVWFIGTSNRDESTRPISDKVYDRSLVMELNHRADKFTAAPEFELLDPVGYAELMSLFEQAPKPTPAGVSSVATFLKDVVGELEKRFRITRTNRFEKQWERFLPVHLGACRDPQRPSAGSQATGEAVDHFLATKLLRPLRERFDPKLEDMLRELRDDIIPICWDTKQWGEFSATQSYRFLDAQLQQRQSHG